MLSKDFPPSNVPSGSISITTKTTPIIKTKTQNNPGLSFFCQPIVSLSKPAKTTATQPMVVSRINLPISRPKEEEDSTVKSPKTPTPGTGKMSVGGIGTFMLRGLLHPQKALLDESKAHRRIEDLEIEKNSLLTLNQTLETVVKEQTNTINDLQKRLAAIERPLTPGLDTTSSENGIMSCSEFEMLDSEEAAFERLRLMLLQLIQQAQSAVSLPSPTSSDNSDKRPKVIQSNKQNRRSVSITTPPASPIPTKRPPSLYKSTSKSSINSVSSNLSRRSSGASTRSSKTPQTRTSKTPQTRTSQTPQTRASKAPQTRDTKKWQH